MWYKYDFFRMTVILLRFSMRYRGKMRDLVSVVKLKGGDGWQAVQLKPSDFNPADGNGLLKSWDNVGQLGLRAYFGSRRTSVTFGSTKWSGGKPGFRNLRWIPKSVN